MRESGLGFEEILEAKLAAVVGRAPDLPFARPAFANGPTAPPTFFGSAPAPRRDIAGPAASLAYGHIPSRPRPASRPRTLSALQQRAVEELRGFGAPQLEEAFSEADLKRVYRWLARRFHPDSHPGAGAEERAYLASAFGRITAAYRRLAVTPAC